MGAAWANTAMEIRVIKSEVCIVKITDGVIVSGCCRGSSEKKMRSEHKFAHLLILARKSTF